MQAAREAEAQAAHLAEVARQTHSAREAEATRQAEADRQAERERDATAARRAEEALRLTEATRQADADRQAEAVRQVEATRALQTNNPAHPVSVEPPVHRPGPNPAANAQPIGRLLTFGPDAPRKYMDSDLGPTWFSPKTTPTAGGESADTQPADAQLAEAGRVDAESTEAKPADGKPTGDGSAVGIDEPGGETSAEGEPTPSTPAGGAAAGDPRAAVASRDSGAATADPAGGSQGVSIDLDITGLMSGLAGATTAGNDAGRADGEAPGEPPAAGEAQANEAQPTGAPADAAPANGARTSAAPAGGAEPAGGAQPAKDKKDKPLVPEDLAAIRWRLDGATLKEVVDDRDALRDLGERLDKPLSDEQDNVIRAGLLSVRAEVYRLLGELGMAAAASRLALAHAESAGDVQATVIARAELAHVLRLRGDHQEADRLFEQAASADAPDALRSVVHENAGRSAFDQGRHMEALDHFARAVRLGAPDDQELVQRIDVALEAVYIHVLRDGWGPYPRLRREILGVVTGGDPE